MDMSTLMEKVNHLKDSAAELVSQAKQIESGLQEVAYINGSSPQNPLVMGLTVFALACFLGYYVVWRVTPALHSPLMSVTNAISSVIIVGAILATGPHMTGISTLFGFTAVVLASINIFGGFIVTQRMLSMFSKPSSSSPLSSREPQK